MLHARLESADGRIAYHLYSSTIRAKTGPDIETAVEQVARISYALAAINHTYKGRGLPAAAGACQWRIGAAGEAKGGEWSFGAFTAARASSKDSRTAHRCALWDDKIATPAPRKASKRGTTTKVNYNDSNVTSLPWAWRQRARPSLAVMACGWCASRISSSASR